jgi:hypothetical protein
MMEAENSSETSVNFYQTTRRNNPEDSHLHTRRRENLKSHILFDIILAGFKVLTAVSTKMAMPISRPEDGGSKDL